MSNNPWKNKAEIEYWESLSTLNQVILTVLMLGTIGLSLVVPNVVQLLKLLPWERRTYKNSKTKHKEQVRKVQQAVYYLRRSGQVEIFEKNGKQYLRVTKKGSRVEYKIQLSKLTLPIENNWDKEFWMVIADIPNSHRSQASRFREKLKVLKMFPLQRTVWLYPFDLRKEIDFLSNHFKVDRFVTYMKVNGIDDEDKEKLLSYFRNWKIL